MVFTMPVHNDGISLTREACRPRNIKVAAACPPSMQREGLCLPLHQCIQQGEVWRVEDFELHKQLYKGKASLLYSATCRRTGTPIALKLYRKGRLSELNWHQVEREIRLHSCLQHDSIISLYAAFEDDQHVYLAQEFASGGDLYEELKRSGGQMKEKRTSRDVLQPCLSALAYLHTKGIIHRDIKPENILLTADKAVKLADFGLSIDASEERPVTRAGTLDYMAPEVLVCPEKSHPRENKDKVLLGYTNMVDAWAMGILAFELIVGHPPFEKESRAATYEHIMYRKPSFPAWMTDEARDFITTALTKAARKRPAVGDLLGHPWIALHQKRAAPVMEMGRGSSCDMASMGSVGSDMSTGTAAPADALRVSAASSSLQGEAARTSGVTLTSAQAPAAAGSPFSGAAMRPSGASISMRGSNVSSIGRNSSEASKEGGKGDSEGGLSTMLSWSSSIRNGVMKLLSSSGSSKTLGASADQAVAAANEEQQRAAGARQLAHTGSVREAGQDSASSLHKWPISHASSAGAEQLSAASRAARREQAALGQKARRGPLDNPQSMAAAAAAKAAARNAAAQLERSAISSSAGAAHGEPAMSAGGQGFAAGAGSRVSSGEQVSSGRGSPGAAHYSTGARAASEAPYPVGETGSGSFSRPGMVPPMINTANLSPRVTRTTASPESASPARLSASEQAAAPGGIGGLARLNVQPAAASGGAERTSPGSPDSVSSLPSPFANVSPRVGRMAAPLSRRRAMQGTGQASSSNLGDTAVISTAGSYSPSTSRLNLVSGQHGTTSALGAAGRRNSVQMPEHALEGMSGSVAPLGIEATRSKSVVLPSSIADAGVRAVHGAPVGSGKALKPSRMSSQGLFAMGVMQGGQHPAQLLTPGEGAEVASGQDRMYAAPGSTPSPLSFASDTLIRAHVPRT